MLTQIVATLPTVYNLRCILIHRDTQQEICELLQLDSDRLCNVLAEVNRRFPGYGLYESWEVLLPEPDEF